MAEMTRDEMIALVARIHDAHDEMGCLLADSGNSPLLAIHARMGRHLHAVLGPAQMLRLFEAMREFQS